MGSSPRTSLKPDEVRSSQLLQDGGTRRVCSGRIQKTGDSKYALIPSMVADMLDVEVGQDVDIFVNLEEGVIIHKIPELDHDGQQ